MGYGKRWTKEEERIHMHGIIFTNNPKEIERIWGYGKVWIGEYVNEKTINYIIKYIHKQDEQHKDYIPKVLTSKGIGNNYIKREGQKNKYKDKNTNEKYKFRNGTEIALPTYYRNKLYNEEEREKLWIKKIEEKKRYINGVEYKIRNNKEITNS